MSYAALEPNFIAGMYDSVITNTSQPSVSGKYWGFLKQFDAERRQQLAEAAAKQADQDAQEAEAEVEKLTCVAKDLQEAGEANRQQFEDASKVALLEKCGATYLLQLKSWHAKNKSLTENTVAAAEETWVLRQDELALQQTEALHGEYFLAKQTLKTATSALLTDGSQLLTLLHGAPPPVILFDYTLAAFDPSLVSKAILFAGQRGVVLLLFSAEAPTMAQMFLQEQEVLTKLNLGGVSTRRVFLNWKASSTVGTC